MASSPLFRLHGNMTQQERKDSCCSHWAYPHINNISPPPVLLRPPPTLSNTPALLLSSSRALSPAGALFGELPIYRLHGNMTQQERKDSYRKFCDAEAGLLFCTDVAARGLDLPHVNWCVWLLCLASGQGSRRVLVFLWGVGRGVRACTCMMLNGYGVLLRIAPECVRFSLARSAPRELVCWSLL